MFVASQPYMQSDMWSFLLLGFTCISFFKHLFLYLLISCRLMHYYMPKRGVLSLHSGCNMGAAGDVTLFFGLSGRDSQGFAVEPDGPAATRHDSLFHVIYFSQHVIEHQTTKCTASATSWFFHRNWQCRLEQIVVPSWYNPCCSKYLYKYTLTATCKCVIIYIIY